MTDNVITSDTIYALASAHGSAGVSVIRVSGSKAYEIALLLTQKKTMPAREAVFSSIFHPISKKIVDKCLLLFFKGPNSFTGEDVLELQVHGSMAIIRTIFSILADQKNVRMAEPGEFSKRAFLNDKMDLTEAEAIADLVAAETEIQAEQALAQMNGSLKDLYEAWRHDLIHNLAYIEADIDFADDDIPDNLSNIVAPKIKELLVNIENHLDDANKGEIIREGIRVAVIGAPNAGKSSLKNILAKRDVAIVSDIAGTTRDIIETHLNICGYPVIMMDTAGLRDTEDTVEKMGVERARASINSADLKLALFDISEQILDKTTLSLVDNTTIVVLNKIDNGERSVVEGFGTKPYDIVKISAKNNQNIDGLISVFKRWIDEQFSDSKTATSPTRARHRNHLKDAKDHLNRALENAEIPELFAEDVRLAARSLGKITGFVDVEDLLDVIFRDFCLGK